jgi:hypothetical protein
VSPKARRGKAGTAGSVRRRSGNPAVRAQQERAARDEPAGASVPVGLGSLAGLLSPNPSMRRWWPDSFEQVLDGASALLDCADPEELEQAAAELLGEVLADRLQREAGGYDLFGWVDALVAFAADRAAEPQAWSLLHALAAICPSRHRSALEEALTAHPGPPDRSALPGWLSRTTRLDVLLPARLLVDGYGCRYGVLLRVARPAGATRTYLIDVDPCSPVPVPLAGMYPDDDDAVAAWREQVGPSGDGATPEPAPLDVLARMLPDPDPPFGTVLVGSETARQLAEFHRALRLVELLAEELARAGTPLPGHRVAQEPVPTTRTATAFRQWCQEQGLPGHDPDTVAWIADDWVQFQPDPAALGPSPHRIAAFVLHLLDFYADTPERAVAVAVVPDWIRFCVQAAELPERLARPALDLAERVADDPAAVAALARDSAPPPLSETTGQAVEGAVG